MRVEAAGRRRYYQLADPEVATLIEALERLAPTLPVSSLGQSQQARAWRQARVCSDHVAGALGVGLMRAMIEGGHLRRVDQAPGTDSGDSRYAITATGRALLGQLGVATPPSRRLVRHHVDSTEDAPHLSGVLGRALLDRFAELGWMQRQKNQRLRITPDGYTGLDQYFGIRLDH